MPSHYSGMKKMKMDNKSKSDNKSKPKTLKEAIEKFEEMKDKPKGNMKSSGSLSKRQKELMKAVKDTGKHTKLHIDMMKYLMTKKNYCFEISHELTQKIVGK